MISSKRATVKREFGCGRQLKGSKQFDIPLLKASKALPTALVK